MSVTSAKTRVRIWDWPTRLSHWLIVGLMPALWWTAQNDELDLHRACGYVMLWVISFRLLWGVIGSSTARFSDFVRGPRTVAAYARGLLKGQSPGVIGHNPLGGWSVVAMLALLTADVGLGLFAVNEDGDQPGPLAKFVSFDQGQTIAQWHGWVFNALLGLIALHLLAIVFYAVVKRDNLVGPMLTGQKSTDARGAMTTVPLSRVYAVIGLAAALTALIMRA